ncbi:MAG: Zn-dependent hydrolase [Chloroflexi bacterium AL-W]|nr:Zn-dependent hydrolase [Chloroflexi bacterium AL-N1]NOK68625.1 Zn-dependent hydrolase [Chloroflexi bacterium AL-N10]NOK76111.1 Zn-dependent hydrolase [Chloroflexi bacterium AL-N5]NOK82584.1 Zn-dependent hydrolase [Chloroflexi bacterium AL-W]NOK93382.1 Zn-dependent hydrolase [Chloroflexi bacterium AL-N15]
MPDVQYLGHSCFRLRGRDGVVLTDPFDRSTGLDIGHPTAHIVTISHAHPDHANVDAVRPMQENIFTIDGPGEYEIGGILITGVRCYHDKQKGEELGKNILYVITIDDVTFCHLGDLGHELTTKQLNEVGAVDVLFIPVGGKETIGAAEAASVIGQLEPRIVIPMHYALNEKHHSHTDLDSLDKFIHELGQKDVTAETKFSISISNLPAEGGETRVVVMKPST